MAAKKKSASRKPAAKKASKKKVAKKKTSKPSPKKRAPARKKAVASREAKPAAPPVPVRSAAVVEIDNRIAIVRNNLRALVEQAASFSGASNEELVSQRISDQEEKLAELLKQRDELSQQKP
jgi:hypothetical protein